MSIVVIRRTLCLFFIVLQINGYAQHIYQYARKNACLDYRFRGDDMDRDYHNWGGEPSFIAIGEGIGKSIPFARRWDIENWHWLFSSHFDVTVATPDETGNGHCIFSTWKHGDCTSQLTPNWVIK